MPPSTTADAGFTLACLCFALHGRRGPSSSTWQSQSVPVVRSRQNLKAIEPCRNAVRTVISQTAKTHTQGFRPTPGFCAAFYFMQSAAFLAGLMIARVECGVRPMRWRGRARLPVLLNHRAVLIVCGAFSIGSRQGRHSAGVVRVAVGAALFALGSVEARKIGPPAAKAPVRVCVHSARCNLATHGFPPAFSSRARSVSLNAFGTLGGAAGKFAVAPLHSRLILAASSGGLSRPRHLFDRRTVVCRDSGSPYHIHQPVARG